MRELVSDLKWERTRKMFNNHCSNPISMTIVQETLIVLCTNSKLYNSEFNGVRSSTLPPCYKGISTRSLFSQLFLRSKTGSHESISLKTTIFNICLPQSKLHDHFIMYFAGAPYSFEISCLFIDWLLRKTEEPSRFYYLTHSWEDT